MRLTRATTLAVMLVIGLAMAIPSAHSSTQYEPRTVKFFDVFVEVNVVHATGQVVAKHDVQGCEDNVPVKLQKMKNDEWVKVGSGRTDGEGFFDIPAELRTKAGTYRAVAPKYFDDTVGRECKTTVSPTDSIG